MVAVVATELVSRGVAGAGRAPALEWVSRGVLVMAGLWFLIQAVAGSGHHARHEGAAFGVVAGLVPCPLTLFAMIMASARGVPAAGLGFAGSMMLGIARIHISEPTRTRRSWVGGGRWKKKKET